MKTAVVTGAAQGVGLATAQMLARTGYHVVLTDRQPLDSLVDLLRKEGVSAEGINGDVASPDFIAELAACVATSDGAAAAGCGPRAGALGRLLGTEIPA